MQNDLANGDTAGASAAETSLQQLQQLIASGNKAPQLEGAKWGNNVITWDAEGGTAAYQGEIQAAFDAWSKATGLTFEEVSNPAQADIDLSFANLDTQTSGIVGYTSYDAAGGQMLSAAIQLEDPNQDALVSDRHSQLTYSGTQATLQQVFEHEIGHALGFADNNNPNSIMDYYLGSQNRTISSGDVAAAQALYGTSSSSAATEKSYLQLIQAMVSFGTDTGSIASAISIPEPYMLTGNIMANNPIQAHS